MRGDNDESWRSLGRHRRNTATLPQHSRIASSGNGLALSWTTIPDRRYQVQYTSYPDQTNWSDLGSGTTATNGTLNISDSITSSPSQRFYQVSLLP